MADRAAVTWLAALENQPIGALATGLPGAAALFRELGLGVCCCAPERTLAAAAAARGLPVEGLLAVLAARAEAQRRAAPAETGPLIDFIARGHERRRAALPGLIALAAGVEAAAGGRPDAPHGLAELLDALRVALGEHMLKEELRVFPLMRGARRDLLAGPLALMRDEHADNAEFLLRAEHLTRGCRAPAGAAPAWERLCAELTRFCDDLVAHVFLEERALFPRFETGDARASARGR